MVNYAVDEKPTKLGVVSFFYTLGLLLLGSTIRKLLEKSFSENTAANITGVLFAVAALLCFRGIIEGVKRKDETNWLCAIFAMMVVCGVLAAGLFGLMPLLSGYF